MRVGNALCGKDRCGVVCHISKRITRCRYTALSDAPIVEDEATVVLTQTRDLTGPKSTIMTGAADQ